MLGWTREACQMRRIDHQYRVELESHVRPGLDVTDARQQQGSQKLAIGQTTADAGGYDL